MSALAADVLDALAADPKALARLADALGTTPTVYTTKTLAAEIGVSERSIRRAIEAGELSATRRCGRWVILAENVRTWASTGGQPLITARQRPRLSGSPSRGAAAMRSQSEAGTR